MAEASVVAVAARSIASALVTDAKYLHEVEDQVRALQRDLECMQEVLQNVDANPNLLKQDDQLRTLTLKMRQLAFRAEDAIDTYLVDVRFKVYNKNFLSKFVWRVTSSYPLRILREEIEDIRQELEVAMTRSEKYRASISATGLPQGVGVGYGSPKAVKENYLQLSDEFGVGIGDDVAQLVNRLTDPQDDFQVLCIVGIGGVGKTTLASQIYRHAKVQSSFPHRAFVSISQQWSSVDLLHCISKKILGRSKISSNETELVRELHDFVKDKKCLVVLDDIWKMGTWNEIYPIFPCTQGFKVILSTRMKDVPLYEEKKFVLHEPKMLTNDQMWAMFSKGAVKGRHGIENDVEFEKLGKLMLQKCHGLPLAVVTLAGILRSKKYLYEWEQVNVALSGRILEGSTCGFVEEMFELSYLELPAHLKPLFLYLAIMMEDKVWTSKQLIEMWIAEGFVANDQIGRSETLEDKGMQFISELAQRYILRVKKRNHRDEIELLYLHDLVREFCIKKASECQFLENISSTHSYGVRTNKPRRVSIFSRGEHCLEENNPLRTIVYEGLSNKSSEVVIQKLESIHTDFKLLRVLKIRDCANKTLPKEIGNLVHLTYLSILDTEIVELPDSVRNLRNLTYLEFQLSLGEGEIAKVPDDLVENMENLRVLRLPDRLQKLGSSNCKRLGLNSEKHKKLHTFRSRAGRWMTKDLPVMQLPSMRCLQITNIDGIEEMKAIHRSIGFLGSLQTFRCEFNGVSKELKFDTAKLMGSQLLDNLCLWGRLVDNYVMQFPPNLVILMLSESEIGESVDIMGVLGQLSKLKDLSIGVNAYLGRKLLCRSTSFPELRKLTLTGLESLEEWEVEEGSMDRLSKIHINSCQKLKRVPQGIRSITTLKKLKITAMPKEFCWRLGFERDEDGGPTSSFQTRGEDSYIIEHIPSVKLFCTIHTDASTAQYPAIQYYFDSHMDDGVAAFKETVSGLSEGFFLPDENEHLNAHVVESYIDEKFSQSRYEPTNQVQAGTAHDPATESCSDSNVDDNKETTLRSGVSGGDFLTNQIERHSPISPDEVTQLASHAVTTAQGTDADNNDINKEEAKRLLFLFGEGYEFEKQMLIQLWMALGLLANEPMEENGVYYFENLVTRGYILCSVPNYLYRVNLEKLGTEVNIEKESYIKLDSATRNSDSSAETLHASVVCDEINASVFETLRGFTRLRTLLFLGSYGSRLQQVPRDLFLCYESLEALDLSGTHIKELPSSARKMVNLRYLDLSWTFLEALPERIDCFKKLQTLKLEGCSRLRRLPNETKGLTHLRHLHLDVLAELADFPKGMGDLVNIRTLSAFPVGTEQGLEISELKYLSHITGSFCIANIENVQSADVAKEAFLNMKKGIKKLNLRWSDHMIECSMNEAECILQNLRPSLNLEEIEIEWYPGLKLPDWIADVSFDKLVSISLFGCANVNMLPSIENLPALASLELTSLNSSTNMGFKGEAVAFPKLQKLSVDEMLNLETWAEAGEGDFPCIKELSIKDCPKLLQFPSIVYAPSLRHLEVSGCESLVLESDKTLPEFLEQLRVEDCPLMEDRCSKDEGQDWYKIQHVPTIWVNHVPIQPIENTEYYP